MDTTYQTELKILRQELPIGVRHALKLLEQHKGSIEKAKKQFQDELIDLVIAKTQVNLETAKRHLVKNRFDMSLTLKSIDEERYSLTERILKKYKAEKEKALEKISYAIEETHALEREFWLKFDTLHPLPEKLQGFMMVMEWLNYESWEDYDSALFFHLESVVEQIKMQLKLDDLANALQEAHEIQRHIYEKNNVFQTEERKHYQKAYKELSKHNKYQHYQKQFQEQRPFLIDALYALVCENITIFP